MTADLTPRAWVGCLACYNNGRLVGTWVDGVDADSVTHESGGGLMSKQCRYSADPELWVFDTENYPADTGEMSPTEATEMATSIASAIDELGDLYPVFAEWVGDYDGASVEDFRDVYAGSYDSLRDFAQEMAGELAKDDQFAEWPFSCIDWDHAARELMYDYTEIRLDGVSHIVRNV